MQYISFKRTALASAVTAALVLTGCGGGDDSPASSDISGVVADGYLQGATVCLDVNENKACDADEPSTTSSAGGAYTLAGVSDTNHPIVVVVGADTIDEDTMAPVGAKYILTAPAGKPEFVSPITTMVQNQLEKNPALSVDDAENLVKSSMGYAADTGVDLFTDYVAAKQDTANADKDEYERLHKVAQVTAQVMENNFSAIETAAAGAGQDVALVMDSLMRILVDQVMTQLSTIASQVDSVTDPASFNPETIATGTVGTVDTTNIADDIMEEEQLSNIAAASMRDIMESGVNWMEADPSSTGGNDYFYGRISLNATGDALVEEDFMWNGTSWAVDTDSHDGSLVLGANGWEAFSDDPSAYSITLNADNSVTLSHPDGTAAETVRGSALAVDGQPIAGFVGEESFRAAIMADAVFSAGAKAYRWSFTNLQDIHELWTWDGDNGFCYDTFTAADFGGNCNTVHGVSQSGAATSFAELVFPAGHDVNSGTGSAAWIGEGLSMQLVDGGDGTSGTVHFFQESQSGTRSPMTTTATWSKSMVHGVELISFIVPPSLAFGLDDAEDAHVIFAVHNGFVRRGSFVPAGLVEYEDGWTVNDIAMDDVKANFQP